MRKLTLALMIILALTGCDTKEPKDCRIQVTDADLKHGIIREGTRQRKIATYFEQTDEYVSCVEDEIDRKIANGTFTQMTFYEEVKRCDDLVHKELYRRIKNCE
jgi:hypothetical protein